MILDWSGTPLGEPNPHITVRLRANQEKLIKAGGDPEDLLGLEATRSSYSVGLGKGRTVGQNLKRHLSGTEQALLDHPSVKNWLRNDVKGAARAAQK